MPPADQPRSTNSLYNLRSWLDSLLVASMVAAASVLAMLELQLGDADAILAACHEGMSCTLTEPQRVVLDKFKTTVDRFAPSGRGGGTASA